MCKILRHELRCRNLFLKSENYQNLGFSDVTQPPDQFGRLATYDFSHGQLGGVLRAGKNDNKYKYSRLKASLKLASFSFTKIFQSI